jgi:hypothetical protein
VAYESLVAYQGVQALQFGLSRALVAWRFSPLPFYRTRSSTSFRAFFFFFFFLFLSFLFSSFLVIGLHEVESQEIVPSHGASPRHL